MVVCIQISEKKFNRLLRTVDLNGNGTIEFDEYCWMVITVRTVLYCTVYARLQCSPPTTAIMYCTTMFCICYEYIKADALYAM